MSSRWRVVSISDISFVGRDGFADRKLGSHCRRSCSFNSNHHYFWWPHPFGCKHQFYWFPSHFVYMCLPRQERLQGFQNTRPSFRIPFLGATKPFPTLRARTPQILHLPLFFAMAGQSCHCWATTGLNTFVENSELQGPKIKSYEKRLVFEWTARMKWRRFP